MMLNIYTLNDRDRWNNEVKSYSNWDVYYLAEYAESFSIHGDGEPLLIAYNDENCRFCVSVMKKDISDDAKFNGLIQKNEYYDLETPYGYGGPLSEDVISVESQMRFKNELEEYCGDNKIVSLFIRFDTLLNNESILANVIESRYLRDTVYIDTKDNQLIISNMDSKCRNMFRKAEKSGVLIERKSISDFSEFIPIYNATMKNNEADGYYIFEEAYYKSLENMSDNACFYYAYLDEKPISAAIMLYNKNNMHYHLSGTLPEYRKFSPGNLLLFTAACDAAKMGISRFHLGGGMSENDSLFGFKKQFNKNGRLPFYVGRMILNNSMYESLLDIRAKNDYDFNKNNSFMIQYRR